MEKALRIHKEVRNALNEKKAVVALESTIITHGMPYPANAETALACAGIIRENGAVPATIAIIDGIIRVGLEEEEIRALAKMDDVMKAGKRDIARALSEGKTASTTVSATIIAARMAGIAVFATGGIGGVHRDFSDSLDVSRDLDELAENDIVVVCAGPKAILDLPATAEYLETKGVEVIGFQTDEMPAFYSRKSGVPVSERLDSARGIADLMRMKWAHGLSGGILVTNPLSEEAALPGDYVETIIEKALAEAARKGVKGKAVTPFLLAELERASAGKTLVANKTLVKENAALAAKIAGEYAKLSAATDHSPKKG